MNPITADELKLLPVGTVLKLVWEDSDTEEGKSNGLMVIVSITDKILTLDDYPKSEADVEMDFDIEDDLSDGLQNTWEYPDSGIEFKLYLYERT